MKNKVNLTLIALVVLVLSPTKTLGKEVNPNTTRSVGITTVNPNTINEVEMTKITKAAMQRTDEASVCIQALQSNIPETALGYCYSWKAQALDDKEKITAEFWVKTAAEAIVFGIASERD